ncbi:uncharacterized protein J3D65DRAFT_191917 [Phyllosticta citribraziliensis]|uniref:F-box domain-containing protein n=1 Tax=Phyllosticta citribraziliensis TaxID=989973 RepID=A0ABR1L1H7_9PEZI
MARGKRSRKRAKPADGVKNSKANITSTPPHNNANANPNGLIGALPGELQNLIISHLTTCSRMHLGATNHYYQHIISVSQKDRVALLLSVERGNMYGCTLCVRLLPLEGFGCAQTFKKRDHGGAEAARRFCIRCGVARRIYTGGNSVRAYFVDGVVIGKFVAG